MELHRVLMVAMLTMTSTVVAAVVYTPQEPDSATPRQLDSVFDARQLRPFFRSTLDGTPVHPEKLAPTFGKLMQLPGVADASGGPRRHHIEHPWPAVFEVNPHFGDGARLDDGQFEFSLRLTYDDSSSLDRFVGDSGFMATLTIRGDGRQVKSAGLVLYIHDSHETGSFEHYSNAGVTTLGSTFVVTDPQHAKALGRDAVSASLIKMVVRTIGERPAREKAFDKKRVAAEFDPEPFQPIVDLYFGS